jgi:predicted ATPase
MADVERLKQMAEAVRQRAREHQEAEDRHSAENFQAWTQTALSQEMRDALQLAPGWDQRQRMPMATFELGTERGRLYRGKDKSDELGTVIFTDPNGRETLSASIHSEDELLLLIEQYL